MQYLLTELFKSVSPGAASSFAANIAGAVVVSLCISPVRKWLERKMHRLLYPKHSGSNQIKRRTSHASAAGTKREVPSS